ncbi:hypothetical protein B296_00000410 [Ensete ventricosum]|uniref:Uncharacterized protein n=1 Tax=Ensete ventricosum TaxID=4639 RepID=A0A427B049_ENSVE|nr:hypothetical protein B296_00000410 [Ensete ventricosum]
MWPPTASPKVTAGLRWPPEMLAAMDTPTKRPKPCARATATRPAGSSAAPDVNLPACKSVTLLRFWNSMFYKNTYEIRTICNGGANAGEHEEEGGDELSKIGLERPHAERVAQASQCELHHVLSPLLLSPLDFSTRIYMRMN